ncbi:MAG: histidine phosphatase family protein, partial [Ginsengibacter sp.]
EAPIMAIRVKERSVNVDCFVSSPAKRAKKTAKIFMKIFGIDKKDLILLPELYEASSKNFYNAIERFDDGFDCVAIFSHNPGITDFVNTLTDYQIDNIPTSGVFAVSFEKESWSDFRTSTKKFLFFDFPKSG